MLILISQVTLGKPMIIDQTKPLNTINKKDELAYKNKKPSTRTNTDKSPLINQKILPRIHLQKAIEIP